MAQREQGLTTRERVIRVAEDLFVTALVMICIAAFANVMKQGKVSPNDTDMPETDGLVMDTPETDSEVF